MTDKPEIKVGQKWVTRGGDVVRIVLIDGKEPARPVVYEHDDGTISKVPANGQNSSLNMPANYDLISLAPSTVKREVALYLDPSKTWSYVSEGPALTGDKRISEPLTIEFTLLPGESAE